MLDGGIFLCRHKAGRGFFYPAVIRRIFWSASLIPADMVREGFCLPGDLSIILPRALSGSSPGNGKIPFYPAKKHKAYRNNVKVSQNPGGSIGKGDRVEPKLRDEEEYNPGSSDHLHDTCDDRTSGASERLHGDAGDAVFSMALLPWASAKLTA